MTATEQRCTTRGRRCGWLGLPIALCLSVQVYGATYTVTGILHTTDGPNPEVNDVPARYIRVIVMDKDVIFDDEKGRGYTGLIGQFSITFTASEAPDVYINVEHVGIGVGGHLVEVRTDIADPAPILLENIEGIVHWDIPAGTLGLGTLRLSNTHPNIINQMGDAVRFLESHGGWTMPEDVDVQAPTNSGGSAVAGDASYVEISADDYDHPGFGDGALSNIHHEVFHWAAYRAYGNRWPAPPCDPPEHYSDTESCEAFAIMEGSAEYFQTISAEPDNMNIPPGPEVWRGEDGTGHDHSGEIVEGACASVMLSVADEPGVLAVLLSDAPDSIREFKDGYVADKGMTSVAVRDFLDHCAANGIVYTRGRIGGFAPGDPPDVGPPSAGNHKTIDNIVFVRGEIEPSIVQLPAGDLRLAVGSATIAADRKELGIKPALPGLAEANAGGFSFLGSVGFSSPLIWDTTGHADGDYDIIARARNIHGWVDTFDPDFTGDSHTATDSTEKWLKTLQTWYNQDAVPDNDDEGKVIVDNTAPTVTGFQPL